MQKRYNIILGLLQLLVAAGALPAGYLMLSEPDGSKLGMTLDILSGSPFKDFFIPGLFLFTVNGVFNLICSILSFLNYRYAYITGFGLGVALLIWVSVQVLSIGLTHLLQPTFFIIGMIEIIISIYIFKKQTNQIKR